MEIMKSIALFLFGMVAIWIFGGPMWAIFMGGMIAANWKLYG